jgi:hypothetical protein
MGVSDWASDCWLCNQQACTYQRYTPASAMFHSRISVRSSCWLLLTCSCSLLLARVSSSSSVAVTTTLMDATGRITVANDNLSTSGVSSGLVTIVTSPGMTSTLIAAEIDKEAVVSVLESGDTLVCRGCTLNDNDGSATAAAISHQALAACSTMSQCLVLEGITLGDVQVAGLRHTRHARTLSALFRARAAVTASASAAAASTTTPNKQVLILAVSVHENEQLDDSSAVVQQVRALFQAATFGFNGPKNLEDWYDLRITPVLSSDAAVSVRVYRVYCCASVVFVVCGTSNAQYLCMQYRRFYPPPRKMPRPLSQRDPLRNRYRPSSEPHSS